MYIEKGYKNLSKKMEEEKATSFKIRKNPLWKKKGIGIYKLIFSRFFEPYATKGACTVPKGYTFCWS